MSRIPKRSWFLAALIAGSVSGCIDPGSAIAPPSPSGARMTLSIANYTTISVSLVVNGYRLETVPPGGYQDPIKAELPGLPWNVQTLSPSGRVLSTMFVRAGDVSQTAYPNGQGAANGDAVRVDLSCGRLDIWSGPPMLGPVADPGPSGDCA
jgi:hypothetical protein